MKGWVGLVGWHIADGLPTIVVTHQLQVERRTGKVRWPKTDVLPLCSMGYLQELSDWLIASLIQHMEPKKPEKEWKYWNKKNRYAQKNQC